MSGSVGGDDWKKLLPVPTIPSQAIELMLVLYNLCLKYAYKYKKKVH